MYYNLDIHRMDKKVSVKDLDLDKLYFARSSFYKTYQTAPLEDWKVKWYNEVNKEIFIRERNLKIENTAFLKKTLF